MIIKCHICKQELARETFNGLFQPFWECPELHTLRVTLNNAGDIMSYMIFFDDVNKNLRYRMESDDHETILQQRVLTPPEEGREIISTGKVGTLDHHREFKRWSVIMTIGHFFPISLNEDQVIQVDNLVPRLLRLKAFS